MPGGGGWTKNWTRSFKGQPAPLQQMIIPSKSDTRRKGRIIIIRIPIKTIPIEKRRVSSEIFLISIDIF
jgi:hypothetical protein